MSHVRVATKYPGLTRRHFEQQGIQAECVKLNGAMELAPSLGLSRRIVDLVSSGATLKANGLEIGRASCREKSVSVRVDLGGRSIIKKKKQQNNTTSQINKS